MWTLEDFVKESNRIEGINRDPFEHEVDIHEQFLALETIIIGDLENLVAVIQPRAVLRWKIGYDVRVGNYSPPPGGPEIEIGLKELLVTANGRFKEIEYNKLND